MGKYCSFENYITHIRRYCSDLQGTASFSGYVLLPDLQPDFLRWGDSKIEHLVVTEAKEIISLRVAVEMTALELCSGTTRSPGILSAVTSRI